MHILALFSFIMVVPTVNTMNHQIVDQKALASLIATENIARVVFIENCQPLTPLTGTLITPHENIDINIPGYLYVPPKTFASKITHDTDDTTTQLRLKHTEFKQHKEESKLLAIVQKNLKAFDIEFWQPKGNQLHSEKVQVGSTEITLYKTAMFSRAQGPYSSTYKIGISGSSSSDRTASLSPTNQTVVISIDRVRVLNTIISRSIAWKSAQEELHTVIVLGSDKSDTPHATPEISNKQQMMATVSPSIENTSSIPPQKLSAHEDKIPSFESMSLTAISSSEGN